MSRPIILALLLFVGTASLGAAEPRKKTARKPVPKGESKTTSTAKALAPSWVRIWKTEFESKRSIRVVMQQIGEGEMPSKLGSFEATSQFGNYTNVSSGTATLKIYVNEAASPLIAIDAVFAPGACSTILIQEDDGKLVAKLIDDTPADGDTAELFVRNLVPKLKTFQLDVEPDVHIRLVSPEVFLHLRGLPKVRVQLNTSGEVENGGQIRWSNGIDFSHAKRATLLIVTDSYGRVRPRVVIDAAHPAAQAPGN